MTAKWAVALLFACEATLFSCSDRGCGSRYTATSSLRIDFTTPHILDQPAQQHSEKEYDLYKKTQQQLLKSRFVLMAALRKSEVAKLPSVQEETEQSDATRWLEGLIKIEFPGDSEIMKVSISRSDPHEAVMLNRAVVDAYMTEVVNVEREQKRKRLSELDRAYVEKETDLRAKHEDLRKLAEQLGVSCSDTLTLKEKLALEELSSYRTDQKKLQTMLQDMRRDLAIQKAFQEDAKGEKRDVFSKEVKRLAAAIVATAEQESKLQQIIDCYRRETEHFGTSTVEIEMMRAEIRNHAAVLAEIDRERERLRVEMRAAPRVALLERAELPECAD